jgi:hypothetical protein
MKKILLFALLLSSLTSYSKDKIKLSSGKTVRCNIVSLEQDRLTYTHRHQTITVSPSDVLLIEVDPDNTTIIEKLRLNYQENPLAACEIGKADAIAYHNRGFGNFCLGFFFGAFGVIGTAVGTPRSPDYVKIPIKENLQNPEYLKCYEKKARGKNVGSAVGGWATFLLILVLANN